MLQRLVSSHWTSNVVVALMIAGAIWAVRAVRRNEIWSEAMRDALRRSPIAWAVLALYVAIGLADSVAWEGGVATSSGDQVARYEARSLLDRVVGRPPEKSYSAPLASQEFTRKSPLTQPGSHLLGTDKLGRDVLYVTLKGCRVALLVGGFTSLISIPLALLFGVLAGYFGKWIDDGVFFVMSTLASMPSVLLLVAMITALPKGTASVCIALGVTSWVGFCRLARGEAFKLRELDYVGAARALGVSHLRIIWRHIIPNLMHLVVIRFVLLFSGLVVSEAVLSWLNIGVNGSWGEMVAQAKNELSRDPIIWWNVTGATVGIVGLLMAVNMVGDTIRDALDPRTKGARN
jgi:peptide/nickel transport system permease protein